MLVSTAHRRGRIRSALGCALGCALAADLALGPPGPAQAGPTDGRGPGATLPDQPAGPRAQLSLEQVRFEARSFEPQAGARFGAAVCTLDFDGDGHDDIAVGAPGESAVYIFFGPSFDRVRRYRPAEPQPGDGFGSALAAGGFGERPGDELVVGAPLREVDGRPRAGALFLVAQDAAEPIAWPFEGLPRGQLGFALALGDFDGDGNLDVAAGAPKAEIDGRESGAVALVSPAQRRVRTLPNPRGSWLHGNYGHDLAAADADGDGIDDLFVSSVGNPSSTGVRGAGQVFVHLRPLAPDTSVLVVEDPAPAPDDPARFGMSISAGDVTGNGLADLLVGAPRKDGGGVEDAGAGLLFLAPQFDPHDARLLLRPGARPHDILGFRALIAPVPSARGNGILLASLAREQPMGIALWDYARLEEGPSLHLAPAGASHHFVRGLAPGPRLSDQPRTLLLGDPNFDPGDRPDTGRALVVELGH